MREVNGAEPLDVRKRAVMRVLLIEDDSATAQSIELMLKSESFNVYTTDLGEEGIDLGKIYDYDIILLDLNLPDVSGFDVLRKLRVSKVKSPVLILSGLVAIEDKIKGLGYGADDYMTKPFHKDELVARIQALVRRSKGHAPKYSVLSGAISSSPHWTQSIPKRELGSNAIEFHNLFPVNPSNQ